MSATRTTSTRDRRRPALLACLLCASGLAAAEPERLTPPPIGLSCALPLAGQAVRLSVHEATGGTCRILGPRGDAAEVPLDTAGQADWTPARYGKYRLLCAGRSAEVWVLASPLAVHWWDERNDPRHASIVMTQRPAHWRSRGVRPVRWVVGEYAARTNGEYASHRYLAPEQWLNDWIKTSGAWDGVAVDELYCGPEEASLPLAKAVALLRQKRGDAFLISVYTSGATREFEAGARLLRESRALCLIESYYGDDALFRKRWQDLKQYGLEKSTLFAIGPGFKLRPDCHGPLTVEEVREVFARVRRVAPESPGIALYNAFSKEDRATLQPALDAACDQAVEDYFLKPVLALAPVQAGAETRLDAWNIGNEDAAGFRLQWHNDAGQPVGDEVAVPALQPQAHASMIIPPAARSWQLRNPAGTVNLYPNGRGAVP